MKEISCDVFLNEQQEVPDASALAAEPPLSETIRGPF